MTNFIGEVIWYFNEPAILSISFPYPQLPLIRTFYYSSIQIASSMRPTQPLKVTHFVPF